MLLPLRISCLSALLALCFLTGSPLVQADDVEESLKFWYRLHITSQAPTEFDDFNRFLYLIDLQARFKDSGEYLFEQADVRTALGYQTHQRVSVWLGYVWRPTREGDTSHFDYENRIFQQLSVALFEHPRFTLDTRTRLEERKDTDCATWAWRFRQKLTLTLPQMIHAKVIPIITEEIFFNLNHPDWVGNQTLDRNRVFIGVLVPMTETVTLEFGYLNQYIPDPGTSQVEHIIYSAVNFSPSRKHIIDAYG